MSGRRKNVPASAAGSDPDLKPGFTHNELLNQIASEMRGVDIEPGDFTAAMLAKKSECSENAARSQLNKRVKSGEIIFVGWHKTGTAKEKVYREA